MTTTVDEAQPRRVFMRAPSATDFHVDLPGVGRFTYGRRTFGDRLAIRAEVVRLTQGQAGLDPDLDAMAAIVARHKVLCVRAPAGWEDLEAVVTEDQDQFDAQLLELDEKLRGAEDSFRSGRAGRGEGAGARANDDAGLLASSPVQPQPA